MKLKDLPGDHFMSAAVAGQATAGTADEFTIGRVPFRAVVTGVWLIPTAAVTGAATNHFTARVRNRVSGAGNVEVAAKAFDNGVNAPAFEDTTITLSATAANLDLAEGDVLTLEKIIVGTGMAMPDGHVVVAIKAR